MHVQIFIDILLAVQHMDRTIQLHQPTQLGFLQRRCPSGIGLQFDKFDLTIRENNDAIRYARVPRRYPFISPASHGLDTFD